MNFPFFIARRYLFSKKSTNAINVISAISVVGVAVATMALVVTLSVFNGFHDLVASFFTSFDPQLKVVPMKGKTVAADDPVLTQIRQLPQIEVATECVEDQALAIYNGHQATVMVKGVDDNFNQLTRINEILVGDGEFGLHAAGMDYGILGIQLAEQLHTGYAYDHPLKVYAPRREGQFDITNPEAAFEEDELYSPGVLFNVKQAKYDKSYIITSIAFARRLFGQQGMLSSLELRLKPGSNFDAVKSEIQRLCGDQFTVRDRFAMLSPCVISVPTIVRSSASSSSRGGLSQPSVPSLASSSACCSAGFSSSMVSWASAPPLAISSSMLIPSVSTLRTSC